MLNALQRNEVILPDNPWATAVSSSAQGSSPSTSSVRHNVGGQTFATALRCPVILWKFLLDEAKRGAARACLNPAEPPALA